MKLAHCGLTILLAAACAASSGTVASARQSNATAGSQAAQAAPAQNGHGETDPLAAAARRAREKKKEQTKPAKVWDNDNIPASNHVSVIGPSAQQSDSSAGENPGATETTGAEPGKEASKSDLAAQLKSAKDDLKNLQTQLDFAQRKLALDQQSFYQNPNYSSDKAGAQALQSDQSQIDAKKQDVDTAQKKVDDLAAKVQAAGDNGSGGDRNSKTVGNSDSGGENSKGGQGSNGGSPQ